jgi:hypothetical protein
VWRCHQSGETWFGPKLGAAIAKLGWPRYFMDFETIQQIIPSIPGSSPTEQLPFQWSVHRWDSSTDVVQLQDGKGFISFGGEDLRVKFLTSLLDVLGDSDGPILVHSIAMERTILKNLKKHPECAHLMPQVDGIMDHY